MGQRVFWYILSEGKVTPVSRQSLPSHRHATGAGLFKCHDIISYESRSALICSSCSCVTTSWLNWTAGLSLSQANTLAAAEAKSLSLPLQFRFVAPSCSAACSDALAVIPWFRMQITCRNDSRTTSAFGQIPVITSCPTVYGVAIKT